MADAGGTNTVIQLSNEGPYMEYVVHNTSVTNGETIPIDGTNGVPDIVAEDKVIVSGGFNHTDEKQLGGGTFSVEYDETAMHFTVTDAGLSDEPVSITFRFIPQGDSVLGD